MKCEACRVFYLFFATSLFNSIIEEHECSKAMVLLLTYCFMHLPFFVGVLCWSLSWYALLYVLSSFSIILTRKRKLVALFLLSFGCLVTVNVL